MNFFIFEDQEDMPQELLTADGNMLYNVRAPGVRLFRIP